MVQYLRNLPILVQGLLGSLLGVTGLGIVVGLALWQLNELADSMNVVSEEVLPEVQGASDLVSKTVQMEIELLRLVSWANSGVVGESLDRQTETAVLAQNAFREAVERVGGETAEQITALGDAYMAEANQTIDMVAVDAGLATMFLNGATDKFDPLRQAVTEYGHLTNAKAADNVADMASAARLMILGFAPIALGAALVAVVVNALMQRLVTSPIVRMTDAMNALAGGSHDIVVPGASLKNELGRMAAALGVFRENAEERARLELQDSESKEVQTARVNAAHSLQEDLANTLDAAARGDFSIRMSTCYDFEEQRDIAQAVNEHLMALDTAIGAISHVLDGLAHANLSRQMEGRFEGAFAKLQSDANATCMNLSRLLEDIRDASHAARQASDSIASGSREISRRAKQQADQLEGVAATMGEMTETNRKNSDGAMEAARLSTQTRDNSIESGNVAKLAVSAIDTIRQSSDGIAEIVSVISSIAFQTNLLALNASVEAARAGDGGKGFAVVASEVRELAQRSSNAAHDISELISDSTQKVRDGVTHVQATDDALGTITDLMEGLTRVVQEMSTAGREQASATEDISSAISNLDRITGENANMADQSASAAVDLASQIARLDSLVNQFQTANQAPAAA